MYQLDAISTHHRHHMMENVKVMDRLSVRHLARQWSLYSKSMGHHSTPPSLANRHYAVAIRYFSGGPKQPERPKKFLERVLNNIKREWSQNKEIKNVEKFRRETLKVEETDASMLAREKFKKVEAEHSRDVNEVLQNAKDSIRSGVEKAKEAQFVKQTMKMTDKISSTTKDTADGFSKQGPGISANERVVWGAVVINGANFVAKTIAWLYTGSHSMFAEAIHSLADTANQMILAVGIRKSLQSPTADHPYGYHPMRYIAPLISGVGIFCVGCGLSIYHGIEALFSTQPELFISPMWAYGMLTFSLVSESTTLIMATRAIRAASSKSNLRVRDYIAQNTDPGLIVVLLEDVAAVMGIGIAASCMFLSTYFSTHVFDACGSLMIGSLLGGVATFIIKKNTVALVGKSIPKNTLNNINRIIEKDVLIRAIHDVKATDLGNGVVRYKAEVDVDGRELTKKYIERIDLKELLEDVRNIKSEKDVETFILIHGEGVVDLLGAEVDRIEKELRRNHPRVKHVDLEVL